MQTIKKQFKTVGKLRFATFADLSLLEGFSKHSQRQTERWTRQLRPSQLDVRDRSISARFEPLRPP